MSGLLAANPRASVDWTVVVVVVDEDQDRQVELGGVRDGVEVAEAVQAGPAPA